MRYAKVKDNKNLVRDLSTSAIINTNNLEYMQYIQESERKKNESNKISNLENELHQLKNDINEIKNLLRQISNGS